MKELSEYDFIYKTKKISNKKITAAILFKTIYKNEQYCFLYESLESSGKIGRYSIMGGNPILVFKSEKGGSEINFDEIKIKDNSNPFDLLRSLLKYFPEYPPIPPFSGGAIGYISYDSVRYMENIPDDNREDPELPDQYLIFPSEIIIIDNEKISIDIIVYGSDKNSINDRLKRLYETIKNFDVKKQAYFPVKSNVCVKFLSNYKKKEFEESVKKGKEYIKKGDIFQVVLSQRFEFKPNKTPFEIYENLRIENPSPYMYFIKLNDLYILGSSPEILIKLENGIAISRPIAGTRKRGKDSSEDLKLEKELLSDEKEISEHIMLVDLARNDLGRVCKFGSIKVTELMKIEKYSKVMHIVSNITGELSKEFDAIELFKASFPAGTVSGSPKIRAMEIIDELETVKRGIYAGGIGYFGFNGDMDFCIAIRTIIIKGERGFIQSGAGIVFDSVPENEYYETLNKAKALKLSLTEET